MFAITGKTENNKEIKLKTNRIYRRGHQYGGRSVGLQITQGVFRKDIF